MSLAAPSPALARLLFGSLPTLAALGPLASLLGGLFAFRIACAAIVVYAVCLLMRRQPWSLADALLLATAASFVVAGLVGLPRVLPEADNPYAELLAVVLGLFTALATRGWQRAVPGLYLSLARGWVIAGLLMSAIAVAEFLTGRHLPGYLESAHPEPAAAFGNPNALAVFLVLTVVWSIPALRAPGALWRTAVLALQPAAALALLLTGARLALLVWLLVVAWWAWRGLRRSRHGLAGLGEALVPLGVTLGLLAVSGRLRAYAAEIGTAGSSGGVRQELTLQGLGFALEQRGLPGSPGSFEALMTERGDLDAAAGLVNAHDVWVEILVQYGALSLLLLLGWLLACLWCGRGARDELAAAVVALLLLGLVDSSLLDDAQLWLLVATLAVASRVSAPPAGAVPR